MWIGTRVQVGTWRSEAWDSLELELKEIENWGVECWGPKLVLCKTSLSF